MQCLAANPDIPLVFAVGGDNKAHNFKVIDLSEISTGMYFIFMYFIMVATLKSYKLTIDYFWFMFHKHMYVFLWCFYIMSLIIIITVNDRFKRSETIHMEMKEENSKKSEDSGTKEEMMEVAEGMESMALNMVNSSGVSKKKRRNK